LAALLGSVVYFSSFEQSNEMALPKIVSSTTLRDALKTVPKIRVIDCTYTVGKKPDYKEFKENQYGKFEELRSRNSTHKTIFLNEHIPGAIHFDIDAAMFPGQFERFSIYEPDVFTKYAQLLGINSDDHLVFYGRGSFGGMLFPSRCYMLFKGYGHKKLSLLDGGFADWQRNGFDVEKTNGSDYPPVKLGDFVATNRLDEFVVKFEEFNVVLDHPDTANLFDSRIRGQFDGTQDTGLDPERVNGTRIPNTTNVPAAEFVNSEGRLKPFEQIKEELFAKYDPSKPTITYCSTGMQASFGAVVQESLFPNKPIRLYNGSLKEMEQRAPKRISDGPLHIN